MSPWQLCKVHICDPMTQGIGLGGACRSCGTIPRTVPRCFSLYHLDHGHNPSNTSCDPWPPGQLGAGGLPYRRVCIYVAQGRHCRLFFPGQGDISLVAIHFR